jgi:beta-phosphoglucomutase
LIFDMDGVLWHSGRIHADAYRQALLAEGLQMPDYTELAGRRTDEVMREMLQKQRGCAVEEQVARLTRTKQIIAHQILGESPPLAHGCAQILRCLARDYRLVLASSGSRRNVQLFLTAFGETPMFERVLSGEDVGVAKPAPDLYLLALTELKLPAEACLVIEDALHGIEAARCAGISSIAITGTHTYSELANSSAFAVINRLDDLCMK